MTAQGSRDERCAPADFIGRVDRIEISRDVAEYLVAAIELLIRLLRRTGQAPARLVTIQRALTNACIGADSTHASSIAAGQSPRTGDDASAKVSAGLDLSQSEPSRVNTATAVKMLQPITANGVRDLCRRSVLDSVPDDSGRHSITVESIEKHARRSSKRAKG